MATTDYDEEPGPSQAEQLRQILGQTVSTITDTDATLPLRTFVLLMVVAACVGFAPDPIRLVGVLAVVALALSSTTRKRPR
jgi:hypothetical protein